MTTAKSAIPARERLIYALDVPTVAEARRWVERLEDQVLFYKVGLQLFLAGGFPMVDWLTTRGRQVMLDLKFFDVPATVERAVAQVAGRGVTFTTVHGNDAIIAAAVAARGDVKILGVTVLTSFSEDDLRHMRLTGTVAELVFHRAQKAVHMGCDGLVSSPLEAARLRRELGNDFFIVTPGIRAADGDTVKNDDQQRVATAARAIADGADYVVVGRPIRDAAEPLQAAAAIQADIEAGLATRKHGHP
ncbi:MAG: orotidine-5'-phosphate decarboxylase [Deltaproteobacteria bacterium]|nr:orotidine-5'-phosphate decarboxylase [Candidatus Anaeroferrophillacea bacterium]